MSEKKYSIRKNMVGFTAYQIPERKEAANLYDLQIPDWVAVKVGRIGCESSSTEDYWVIVLHTSSGTYGRFKSGDFLVKNVNNDVVGVKQEVFSTFFTEV